MPRHKTHACQQDLFDPETPATVIHQKHKASGNYGFDILDAITAPVLTFSSIWSIPRRLLDIVPLARMKALMLGEQTATLVECSIYIYTRTLESPMDAEWVDIYTHVCCKALEEWFNENHWEEVRAPRKLNEWLQSKLQGLRKHIYDKRRAILKQELGEEPSEEQKSAQQKTPPQKAKGITPDTGQPTLF